MKTLLVGAIVFVWMLTSAALAGDIISWKNIDKYYGQTKTVEGALMYSNCTPAACYFSFDPDWKNNFTAVMFSQYFDKFPSSPDKYYRNKKVRITGVVKDFGEMHGMLLSNPKQIEVIE